MLGLWGCLHKHMVITQLCQAPQELPKVPDLWESICLKTQLVTHTTEISLHLHLVLGGSDGCAVAGQRQARGARPSRSPWSDSKPKPGDRPPQNDLPALVSPRAAETSSGELRLPCCSFPPARKAWAEVPQTQERAEGKTFKRPWMPPWRVTLWDTVLGQLHNCWHLQLSLIPPFKVGTTEWCVGSMESYLPSPVVWVPPWQPGVQKQCVSVAKLRYQGI